MRDDDALLPLLVQQLIDSLAQGKQNLVIDVAADGIRDLLAFHLCHLRHFRHGGDQGIDADGPRLITGGVRLGS
ncbi:hypothetical protein D3C80_1277400 [compost metagenome]